ALEAEIRREVAAYEAEGLVVVVRRPGRELIAPATDAARGLASQMSTARLGGTPVTLAGPAGRYRAIRTSVTAPEDSPTRRAPRLPLALGLSRAETEAILAQFDRRVAAGGLAFLTLVVLGSLLLAHRALRPVALSIRTARHLNPADLSARLP